MRNEKIKSSQYFVAEVVDKGIDVFEEKHIKIVAVSWLRKEKIISFIKKQKYYILCKIEGTRDKFLIKIPVEKEVYEQANPGAELSLHLKFEFEYAVFYFLKKVEVTDIVG